MAKKLTAALVAFMMIMSFMCFNAIAKTQDIVVMIDGQVVDFPDAKPFINQDSRTLCPIRFIAENLGADITWNGETRTVLITKESTEILLSIGDNKALVNGTEKTFDTVPQIFEDRTYVPLRFISEAFNMDVNWDNQTKTVLISTPFDEQLTLPEHFDKYLTSMEKNRGFNGSVLIAKDDEILFSKGYGYSNIEEGTKNTSDTKFAIADLTTTFTSMAIMQLYEKGLLDLDDAISKYISGMVYGEQITIKHLMTHTSGIIDYMGMLDTLPFAFKDLDRESIVEIIINSPPLSEPTVEWRYNRTGYILLGHIVEKISKLTLEEYFEENIFKPLKMNNTGTYSDSDQKLDLAKGYMGFLNFDLIEDTDTSIKNTYGSGYMYSTVEDLFKWDMALKTDKLVKLKTLDMIFDPYVTDDYFPGGFGLGWFIFKSEDLGDIIYHPGAIDGFTSYISRYIDENYTIIIAINKDNYNYDSIAETLLRILNKKHYQMPSEFFEIQLDSKTLQKYIGLYEHVSGDNISIIENEDQLYAKLPGQGKVEIFPMSETEFFYKIIEAYITFEKNDSGEIVGLQFKKGDIIIDTIKTDSTPREKKVVEVDPVIFEKFVGNYEFESGLMLTISTKDDKIFAQMTDHLYLEIFPMSKTRFFYEEYEAEIEFIEDEDGNIVGVVFEELGYKYDLIKK